MSQSIVETRLADLTAATAALLAYSQQDRPAVVQAMQAITPGRGGEALLALGVLLADQVARANGQPTEQALLGVMAALMDPDERMFASLAAELAHPEEDPTDEQP